MRTLLLLLTLHLPAVEPPATPAQPFTTGEIGYGVCLSVKMQGAEPYLTDICKAAFPDWDWSHPGTHLEGSNEVRR